MSLTASPWGWQGLARAGLTREDVQARIPAGCGLHISAEAPRGPWIVSNGLHPKRAYPRTAELRVAIDRALAELEGVRDGQ